MKKISYYELRRAEKEKRIIRRDGKIYLDGVQISIKMRTYKYK